MRLLPSLVGALLALGTAVWAIVLGRKLARTRRLAGELRAAVQAQIWAEQAHELDLDQRSETLAEVLARSHDLNNSLMAVGMSVDALLKELLARGPIDPEVEAIAGELKQAWSRIVQLTSSLHQVRNEATPDAVQVDVTSLLDAVAATVTARFADIELKLDVDRERPHPVRLRGGAATLTRVLEGLLTNACEGDGAKRARRVSVRGLRDPSGGCLRLVIADDGPGFSAAQLAAPIAGLVSTKAERAGLGLYTIERLVRAGGGSLERANASNGGAELTLLLPLDL